MITYDLPSLILEIMTLMLTRAASVWLFYSPPPHMSQLWHEHGRSETAPEQQGGAGRRRERASAWLQKVRLSVSLQSRPGRSGRPMGGVRKRRWPSVSQPAAVSADGSSAPRPGPGTRTRTRTRLLQYRRRPAGRPLGRTSELLVRFERCDRSD